jgi:hypothetical protein
MLRPLGTRLRFVATRLRPLGTRLRPLGTMLRFVVTKRGLPGRGFVGSRPGLIRRACFVGPTRDGNCGSECNWSCSRWNVIPAARNARCPGFNRISTGLPCICRPGDEPDTGVCASPSGGNMPSMYGITGRPAPRDGANDGIDDLERTSAHGCACPVRLNVASLTRSPVAGFRRISFGVDLKSNFDFAFL